jgi:nitrogen regulatory protein P-II 1
MKKIEVIIRPFQLDDLRDALAAIKVDEIIVSDIRCTYGSGHDEESYLSEDYFVEFLPKIKIETFVRDEVFAQVVETIKKVTQDEANSNTRIYLYDVTEA